MGLRQRDCPLCPEKCPSDKHAADQLYNLAAAIRQYGDEA